MSTGTKTLILIALACCAPGCGNGNAEFRISEKTKELMPEAQAPVTAALANHFGTPQELVAWLKFPVDYGVYEGEVVEAVEDAENKFRVNFVSTELNAPEITAADLIGLGVLWNEDASVETTAELEDGGKAPVYYLVSDYDAETSQITLETALKDRKQVGNLTDRGAFTVVAAQSGDRFTIVGGHLQKGRRLYMEHCMHCHGVTGDGDGPTAKYLDPLPRDYRHGVFKFTSTTKDTQKPSRDDLERTIKLGIPGTYMPSFLLMDEDEIEAIIEYVRWLSTRGEMERKLVAELSIDYSNKAVEERTTGEGAPTRPEIVDELNEYLESEFQEVIVTVAEDLTDSWNNADDPASVVLPKTGREKSVQGVAAQVAPWIREQGRSILKGSFQKVVEQKKQVEGQKDPQKVLGMAVEFESKTDAPPAGRELLWVTGALKGTKHKIGASQLSTSTMELEPPLLKTRLPKPGDQFVVNDTIPDEVAYIAAQGTQLDRLVEIAENEDADLNDYLLHDSIDRGRNLYLAQKAKCASCHGPTGRGDGFQTEEFQEIPGTNPAQKYPKPGLYDTWNNSISPRNLATGIYRGGRRPIDLYRRISEGIKGTPMPAFGGTVLTDREIWDIVNYVYYIPIEARLRVSESQSGDKHEHKPKQERETAAR